jgi:hypothetical protein
VHLHESQSTTPARILKYSNCVTYALRFMQDTCHIRGWISYVLYRTGSYKICFHMPWQLSICTIGAKSPPPLWDSTEPRFSEPMCALIPAAPSMKAKGHFPPLASARAPPLLLAAIAPHRTTAKSHRCCSASSTRC